MTIYKGRVGCRKIATTLHGLLLTEGYQEISSDIVTNGRVYKSTGIDGTNELYFNLKDPSSNYLTIGVYEKYVPNPINGLAGVFTNGYEGNSIVWNSSASAEREEVDYVFNINKDRLIIFIEGMKAEPNRRNSLTYIGMPLRYDKDDKGNGFAGIAYTAYGSTTTNMLWKVLRNRALQAQDNYLMDFYLPSKSYGWGGRVLFSPLFLGTTAEGARGELDGLLIAEKTEPNTEMQHGDVFVRNGKTYMLIVPISYGSYSLSPGYDYIIEI